MPETNQYLRPFFLDDWKPEKEDEIKKSKSKKDSFPELCSDIKKDFEKEWEANKETLSESIQLLKDAIIGKDVAVIAIKNKISDYLRVNDKQTEWHPAWYEDIVDAVFHENWGLAGLAEFFSPKYKDISSAKVIGDRIYFLVDGTSTLMPQTISTVRRQQLVRGLCMDNPSERFDKDFHSVYINPDKGNERITIYNESMTKKGQDVIIFRRYIIPNYTFEEQVKRSTMPKEIVPFLTSMVRLGYNTSICGPIMTAKTSILAVMQSCEDPSLEGIILETDPEIDASKLNPGAPIIQIIADGERLSGKEAGVGGIVKSIMRSDTQYFVLAEGRDGLALDTIVTLANKGTRRSKMTFHTKDPEEFCTNVATEIVRYTGGDLEQTEIRVAKSFDYIIHMTSLKDKSQKRLKGIYDLSYDAKSKKIKIVPICNYIFKTDSWEFKDYISPDKIRDGINEDENELNLFRDQLKSLAKKFPMSNCGKEEEECP